MQDKQSEVQLLLWHFGSCKSSFKTFAVLVTLLLLFALYAGIVTSVSIERYGAVPSIRTAEAALKNAAAMKSAFLYANSSAVDRIVEIPLSHEYYFGPVLVDSIFDVTIKLDGTIRFTENLILWGNSSEAMMWLQNFERLTITGNGAGKIDGQGLNWWRLAISGHEIRPKLLRIENSQGIHISHITLLNSPRWNLLLDDCADVVIHDVTIFTDQIVDRKNPKDPKEPVTYPLNTDGIDIKARNVTIYNCNITVFDDAIVPKPCNLGGSRCTCASDILAYNNSIYFSTGLAIGSIPPNVNTNCIRNVTFRDSYMYRPLKAIYIKTNPGTNGNGIIEDITYQNIFIEQALWWTIFIGPQQQNQPGDAASQGCCFVYPYYGVCPTQPLVSIKNIKLINITAIDTPPLFMGPGLILGDALSPIENLVFENVNIHMFTGNTSEIWDALPFLAPEVIFPTRFRPDSWTWDYFGYNVYGTVTNCDPAPSFFSAPKALK